jgi:predicted transcriptional regulator
VQVWKGSRLTHSTIRQILKKLHRDGVVERRLNNGGRKCTYYLYRNAPNNPDRTNSTNSLQSGFTRLKNFSASNAATMASSGQSF